MLVTIIKPVKSLEKLFVLLYVYLEIWTKWTSKNWKQNG